MSKFDQTSIIRIARENGNATPVEPLNLGQQVRELRRAKGWMLEQSAGLARSTLSKIENGQMSPT